MESSPAIDFVIRYGYLAVFLVVMIENIEFFGSFPTSVIAAAMGAVSAEGIFNPVASIAVLTIASVVGDVIGYFLGRKFGRPLLMRWGKNFIAKNNRLERTESIVQKYGVWSVFFSRFILASLQAIINIICGITRMRFVPFLIAALLGEFVWTLVYFGLGYYAWASLEGVFRRMMSGSLFDGILTLAGVAAIVVLIYQLRKRFFSKQQLS